MTQQDLEPFAVLMLGLGETYGEPITEARMEIYFRALMDLPLEAIKSAVSVHVRSNKFFPRPSEIIEAIDGNPDDRAELAWAHVQRQVRSVGYTGQPTWPDTATKRAAYELYGGGWQRLCASLPADGPELLGYAKQFKATYRSYVARDARHRALETPQTAGEIESEAGGPLPSERTEP